MDVGIITRWRRREDTYVALELAEFLATRFSVSFLTPTTTPVQLHPTRERALHVTGKSRFTEWSKPARLLVWTICPTAAQVEWAKRRDQMTVLIASCKEPDEALHTVYAKFDHVIAPTQTACDFLAHTHGLTNVTACPWSPFRRVCRNDDPVRRPARILLPLDGAVLGKIDVNTPALVSRLLRQCDASLTVVRGNWRGGPRRQLDRLERKARARLTVLPLADYNTSLLRMARHDCTALLPWWDGIGLTGLHSLHVGTPIVAWATAPALEYARHGRNARLVPETEPLNAFADALCAVAREPAYLSAYRLETSYRLAERRKRWETVWTQVLKSARLI